MGRQSLRSPFPIAVRTSSINAETVMYDAKPLPKKKSRGVLRGASERNQTASAAHQRDLNLSSPSSHELRVRASSPLLGRSYHSNEHPPQLPPLRQPSSTSNLSPDRAPENYAFDTQSQRSLAYGMVEDMRGIGFPNLEKGSSTNHDMNEPPKRKPSRLDLSLLFPKPKPAAAPLLSPQRYTHSPSPVRSESSVKVPPNKLSKPRAKSIGRSSIQDVPILEEPLPLPKIRRTSQKPMEWFDVPLEKIIRLGDGLDAENEEDDEAEESGNGLNAQTAKKIEQVDQPSVSEPRTESNSTTRPSVMGSERSYTPSIATSRTSRDSRISGYYLNRKKIPPPSLSRTQGSLQSWQSEGDLRSSQNHKGRLSKKKSSRTFMTLDLTKTSVLSLSSSESESEDDDCTEEDEYEGERILSRAAVQSRAYRDSFATNDYVEPEICHAQAVVATKSYGFTRPNRTSSTVSSTSSGSRNTLRHPTSSSRGDSFSRSPVSGKMLGPSSHVDYPLIEESEEQADQVGYTARPRQRASKSYNDLHSEKRRSRIIAVTRQEQSILEAMRQRSGRITPSIFQDIDSHDPDSKSSSSPPKIRSPEAIQTEFDTSFLRLSTAMRLPPGSPPGSPPALTLGENSSSREKDTCTSLGSASDTEQRTDSNNIYSASPRLSLVYSETPSSASTLAQTSPVTPPLPIRRYSPRAPPPSHAPPPVPEDVSKRHSRRRTDSSGAIVLDGAEAVKTIEPPSYPLWAVKWGRGPNDVAFAH